jgi:nucleoid DNA-binding protein
MKNKSYFAQKLISDPELAEKCEAIVKKLHDEIKEELEALERSQQLTAQDFAVYINAKPYW